MEILKQFINEEGKRVTQYSRDGVNVTHTVVDDVPQEVTERPPEIEPQPEDTVEQRLDRIEQTTAYTQLQIEYLTTLSETNTTK